MPSGDQSFEGIIVGVAVIVVAKTFDQVRVWRQSRPRKPKTISLDERVQLQHEWAEFRREVRVELDDCREQREECRQEHEDCRAENETLRSENDVLLRRVDTMEQRLDGFDPA